MSIDAKFCHVCGRALAHRYPGCYLPEDPPEHIKQMLALPPDQRVLGPENLHPQGDPENGPKSLRCPAGHMPIEEEIEEGISQRMWGEVGEYLTALSEGQRDDPHDLEVPGSVQAAALLILAFCESQSSHWNTLYHEQERLAEESERYPTDEEWEAAAKRVREQEEAGEVFPRIDVTRNEGVTEAERSDLEHLAAMAREAYAAGDTGEAQEIQREIAKFTPAQVEPTFAELLAASHEKSPAGVCDRYARDMLSLEGEPLVEAANRILSAPPLDPHEDENGETDSDRALRAQRDEDETPSNPDWQDLYPAETSGVSDPAFQAAVATEDAYFEANPNAGQCVHEHEREPYTSSSQEEINREIRRNRKEDEVTAEEDVVWDPTLDSVTTDDNTEEASSEEGPPCACGSLWALDIVCCSDEYNDDEF